MLLNGMRLWIAKCWGLRLYEYKPELHVKGNYKCFLPSKGKVYEIDEDLFPEITFENSPQRVELKLIVDYEHSRNIKECT